MSEGASSKFGGIFQKKGDQRKVDNPATTKKKKHRRLPSVRLPKDWKFHNYKADDGNRPSTEPDEADGLQPALKAVAPIEIEKPRKTRLRLPFGKSKAIEKPGLHSAAQCFLPEGSDAAPKPNKVQFETAIDIIGCSENGNEQIVESVRSEEEEKEAFLVLLADAVPKELVSDVTSNIQEPAGMFSQETLPDVNSLVVTIPNPEGYSDLAAEKTSPIMGLPFNSLNRARVAAISSISQFEIRLSARDFSLAKLIGLWSFIVSQASNGFRQLLLYFVSSLIKRYPQCFNLQVTKRKRLSKREEESKVHTTI